MQGLEILPKRFQHLAGVLTATADTGLAAESVARLGVVVRLGARANDIGICGEGIALGRRGKRVMACQYGIQIGRKVIRARTVRRCRDRHAARRTRVDVAQDIREVLKRIRATEVSTIFNPTQKANTHLNP